MDFARVHAPLLLILFQCNRRTLRVFEEVIRVAI